jgi:hypothetical protein
MTSSRPGKTLDLPIATESSAYACSALERELEQKTALSAARPSIVRLTKRRECKADQNRA